MVAKLTKVHKKKVKKLAKKSNGGQPLSSKTFIFVYPNLGSRKDPGIPNLYPYKEKLLKLMDEAQQAEKADLEMKKELRKRMVKEAIESVSFFSC